jgi:hypothetical protein
MRIFGDRFNESIPTVVLDDLQARRMAGLAGLK